MQLIIEGKNVAELKSKISELYQELCGEVIQRQTEMDIPKAKSKKAKPKVEKNLSSEEVDALSPDSTSQSVETTTPDETVNASASSDPVPISKEYVSQKLQELNKHKGINVVREVMQSFNTSRISEMKPDLYPAFITKCNELLSDI